MSPDGHYLVESSFASRQRKWLRPLDGAEARPIPGSEDWDGQEFWSPDSRYLAFAVPGKLQKMPIAGGPTELICPVNETPLRGAWSPSGVILLAGGNQLFQVPAGGGTLAPALKEVPEGAQIGPQFLPDGKQFLFYLIAKDGDKTGTYLALLGGGAPRFLLPRARSTYARQGSEEVLLFTQRGTWMQKFDSSGGKLSGVPVKLTDADASAIGYSLPFAASQSGVAAWQEASTPQSELIWLDQTGRKTGIVAAPASASNPKISWQGGRVAYTAANEQEIGFSEVARDVSRTVVKDAGRILHPVWSPDGSMIAYYANRQILLRHADTDANPVGVAKMDLTAYLHDWSRDGRYITYTQILPKGGDDLMALPMNGDKASGALFWYSTPLRDRCIPRSPRTVNGWHCPPTKATRTKYL